MWFDISKSGMQNFENDVSMRRLYENICFMNGNNNMILIVGASQPFYKSHIIVVLWPSAKMNYIVRGKLILKIQRTYDKVKIYGCLNFL